MAETTYTIEKQPTPMGTMRKLKTPVTVNSVTGVDNVYEDDGELRGSMNVELAEDEYLAISVTYLRKYEDGTESEFVTPEKQDAEHESFTLSLAPFGAKSGVAVASVDITATSEKKVKVT